MCVCVYVCEGGTKRVNWSESVDSFFFTLTLLYLIYNKNTLNCLNFIYVTESKIRLSHEFTCIIMDIDKGECKVVLGHEDMGKWRYSSNEHT